MNNDYISLYELYQSKKIYWIESFPTLRKWVVRDHETNNVLDAKIINTQEMDKSTGTRYYIPVANIDAFISAFNDGTLYGKR